MTSPSLDVRVIANIAAADIRSSTGNNLFNLGKEAGENLTMDNLQEICRLLLDLKTQVPMQDTWRLGCLRKFLSEKYALVAMDQDTDEIDYVIDDLASNLSRVIGTLTIFWKPFGYRGKTFNI